MAQGVCKACGKPRDNETTRCEKCRQKNNQSGKSTRQARFAKVLCQKCGRANSSGGRWCATCRAAAASRQAAKCRAWKAAGLCATCGKDKSDRPGKALCLDCSNRNARFSREHSRKRRDVAAARAKVLEGARRIKQHRKLSGRCCSCGSPNDNIPRINCKSCAAAASERERDRRRRRAPGLCTICGRKERAPGLKSCIECRAIWKRYLTKWRRKKKRQRIAMERTRISAASGGGLEEGRCEQQQQ